MTRRDRLFTVDADGISVSADVANNAAWLLAAHYRQGLLRTSAASVSIASAGMTRQLIHSSRTNAAGAALTETVTGTNAGIALSTGEFKTITSITAAVILRARSLLVQDTLPLSVD